MSTVLVVGSGGREHALAWKLAQSPRVTRLIVAPGNDGMPQDWERWPTPLTSESFEALAKKCVAEKVDLAVIGPDNPLADGIVDVLNRFGILAFGPTARAAQIESSKAFAKELMKSAGVSTAEFFVAKSLDEANKILGDLPWDNGWVVKADGLAFGKGVFVCGDKDEALRASQELFKNSSQIVIEEKLQGEEISWMAFCDGERCALFDTARDHKRLLDDDRGPNTGGMGVISPVPSLPPNYRPRVRDEVFLPVLRALKSRSAPFRGILYAGLMVDVKRDKIWVLEFNARFGDPEAQVLLPRMNADLYSWCEASAKGDLSDLPKDVPFVQEAGVFVVAAAQGYPENPRKGDVIEGVPAGAENYFFAGVKAEGKKLVTQGGRVLGALGLEKNLDRARELAYQRLEKVQFQGMQYRRDIGRQG